MANVNLKGRNVGDPPLAQRLFNSTRAAWFWLPFRIWLGYKWIDAALHKVNSPAWVQTGDAIKGFWTGAVAIPDEGRPAIAFDWYRSFLQFMLDANMHTFMGKAIAYGELLVGIGLILGAFTGIAAFFGALMNWNFMMAGSASSNPVLLIIAIGLVLGWKVSGLIGLDYFLLPLIGTPWKAEVAETAPEKEAATAGA